MIEDNKKDQFKELNEFIVDYFQEWLDLNSLSQFKSQVNFQSKLQGDWLAFENIYASIRYYSRKSVLTMAEVMRAKWAQNKN